MLDAEPLLLCLSSCAIVAVLLTLGTCAGINLGLAEILGPGQRFLLSSSVVVHPPGTHVYVSLPLFKTHHHRGLAIAVGPWSFRRQVLSSRLLLGQQHTTRVAITFNVLINENDLLRIV